jgi:hypothetical protein
MPNYSFASLLFSSLYFGAIFISVFNSTGKASNALLVQLCPLRIRLCHILFYEHTFIHPPSLSTAS